MVGVKMFHNIIYYYGRHNYWSPAPVHEYSNRMLLAFSETVGLFGLIWLNQAMLSKLQMQKFGNVLLCWISCTSCICHCKTSNVFSDATDVPTLRPSEN